jgi:hypothetical protein
LVKASNIDELLFSTCVGERGMRGCELDLQQGWKPIT